MLKLLPVSDLDHLVEDVLGAVREGSRTPDAALIRVIQRGIDAIAAQVDAVADGAAPPPHDPALDEALTAAKGQAAVADPAPPRTATPEPVPAGPIPAEARPDPGAAAGPKTVPIRSGDTVRVPLGKLDELIRLLGEVVSSHARLRQRLGDIRTIEHGAAGEGAIAAFARDLRDDVFAQERLMEELHAKALVMRMLPLAIVTEPAARLVRDLARSLGKDVRCVVAGTDIELDRQIIDHLNDPLIHLLRNAVDHGIEEPARRAEAGKPAHGTIRLGARQDGSWVVIEVADDGGGIQVAAVREKAVRKGIITAEQAAAMTEAEAIDLIFAPGFSTSPIVTDVSGRGVGMDVVKRTIVDDMRGVVEVDTALGRGTTFSLRLPLSLAVMRVLTVTAGGHDFGFTAQHIVHILELAADRLLRVAGREAVVFDNEFVPVVALAPLIGLPDEPRWRERLLLVVVRGRGEKVALRVDSLVDERDMVIKPLPDHLRGLSLVAGMVMNGRDELVSVLHVPALHDRARAGMDLARAAAPAAATGEGRVRRVLVVDDSLNTREIEKDVLEAHGYVVTLAEDGLDGLRKARQGDFDAVLTDVEMPRMDGFSLTAALRVEKKYHDRPIIIVTSLAREEDKRRGIEVGADAYIVKGDFEQTNLVNTLRSLIG
jgi:chemotaxis protein histidine kinase CheA